MMNCNDNRISQVSILPVTTTSIHHYDSQTPEEIQVEPIFEYYQNYGVSEMGGCSSLNINNYLSSSSSSSSYAITNEYNGCQLAFCNGKYEYQEPEENFISIDDAKVKPFLVNMLKNDQSKSKKPSSDINKSTADIIHTQKDVDCVVIDDDDDDENEDKSKKESEKITNSKIVAIDDDEMDDVILIDDDEDEIIDENEVGEELDWMALEQEQDKQTYECFLCNKKVASSYNLRRHMMIHTGERPFGCDICYKRFREFSDLKKHRRVHCHEKEYKCMICKTNPPSSTNPTKCTECDHEDRQNRTTNYGDIVLGEIPCIEGSDKKAYVCPICDRIFGSRHNLKRHFMIHTGEKPYKCDVCDKAFREVSTLKKHMLTHSRIKLFKCTQCGKEYSDFGSYTRHKNLYHGLMNDFGMSTSIRMGFSGNSNGHDDITITSVRSGSAAIAATVAAQSGVSITIGCDQRYQIGRNNLNDIINDEYLFECSECYKKFTNASVYKEHLKIHSRDFTFQCYICKRMFRTKEKLNAHFVIHDYDDNDHHNSKKNNVVATENIQIQNIEQKPLLNKIESKIK